MKTASVLALGGGFAYGVRQGGGELVGLWENGFGRPLVERNLPNTLYLNEDWSNPPAGLDLVFGCPPCAGWSNASAGLSRQFNPDHPINDGIRRWFEAVEIARPQMACFECVQNLAINGRELWGPLVRRLEEDGYSWKIVLYDNMWLGVPQIRKRQLLWVYKGHGELEFPVWWDERPFHPVSEIERPLPPDRIIWQRRLSDDKAQERLYPWIEPGRNIRTVSVDKYLELYYEPGRREGWPSFTIRRLHRERPAPAMMANSVNYVLHYDDMSLPDDDEPNSQVRTISGRELARIMGYPDEFELDWDGAPAQGQPGHDYWRGELSKWLCQAVSPAVGRWAALTAETYLEQSANGSRYEGRVVNLAV